MAKGRARKIRQRARPQKSAKAAKRTAVRQKTKPRAGGKRPAAKKKLAPSKKRKPAPIRGRKAAAHVAQKPAPAQPLPRKRIVYGVPLPAPIPPPRLLRDTRSTSAALGLLEKGIKLIYQKEFKRARLELQSLFEQHPGEPVILARARSYLQICDREEAAHRKPAITNDQLYTLGVMEHNRGAYDAAVAYFRQSLEKHPDTDHIYYSLAASLAKKGEAEEAVRCLRRAIELSEDNRVYAKNDADFSSLHAHREFTDLVGLIPPVPGETSSS